jgi:(p)ppGpp synthase/HD superfamily hydrolase
MELVAAWDHIWSRLPAETGVGANAATILTALKLLLATAAARGDEKAQTAAGACIRRGLEVAVMLADLACNGLPLDADAIAAGILADGVGEGWVTLNEIDERLGGEVCGLLHDVQRVRNAPQRVDLSNDQAARLAALVPFYLDPSAFG